MSHLIFGLATNLRARRMSAGILATLAVSTAAVAAPAPKGDAAAGGKAFAMRCAACHGAGGAGGAIAPSLTGVFGAHAAAGGFTRYSAALKGSNVTWTPANLDAYLAAPSKRVPGTSMMVAVANAEERANLVAYLASLKSPARKARG